MTMAVLVRENVAGRLGNHTTVVNPVLPPKCCSQVYQYLPAVAVP
jgi:hypothetical protein